MKKIKYLLTAYLLLGLFVSSIGVTWCRYQVAQEYEVKYQFKTTGDFQIDYDSDLWQFDETTQIYSNQFSVSNKNDQSNYLTIFINTTNKANYSLIVIENSGREVKYDSLLIRDENQNYQYKFIDKQGNPLKLELEGNSIKKQDIRLEANHITDAFLTEIIFLDASYDIQTTLFTTIGQYQELILNSNYLTLNGNNHVILDDNTINITLDSNMNITTKLITNDENALLNNQKELDLNLITNESQTITLDVTKVANESTTVEWQILDNEQNIIQTLKANFIKKQTMPIVEIVPAIQIDYIENNKTVNQYNPIQCMIQSDIDTNIQLGTLYPANTYYTFDQGENWYITTTEGELDIPLLANKKTQVTIDLTHTDIEWEEIEFDVTPYFGNIAYSTKTYQMENVELPALEITKSNMGLINTQDLLFTLNTENVKITFEEKINDNYIPLEKEYFLLEKEDSLTYTIKPNNIEIPKGIYKIRIQQFYKETLIHEKELSFFAIEQKEVNS